MINKKLSATTKPFVELKELLPTGRTAAHDDRAQKHALDLFHRAAQRVPAYKAFLKSRGIDPVRIKTMSDFAKIPITDAKNYISAYPVKDRCWDGDLPSAQFIAASSGTTGEPKFWPRNAEQDLEAAMVHELLYREYFSIQKRTTLFLIGFPMGIYVSGIATLLPTWLSSFKKYPMTVMSIGNNKKEMLRAVKHLSHQYDQTILIGHPFFIKDVIESGAQEGIVWAKKNLGLMFCSEGFSEVWRNYIIKKAGIPRSAMRVFNTYGSSEMLLMGYETQFSIGVKALAEKNQTFLNTLTGGVAAPQFFQYNPHLRYIESVDNELIFTSESGIPLIRFNLHDRGSVYSVHDIKTAMGKMNIKPVYPAPLVALWGRSDQTIIFYAANIYPEHIKAGLNTPAFFKKLTGKFTMRKDYIKNLDEFLEINVELQQNIQPTRTLANDIQKAVLEKLEKVNLEYKFLREHLDKDIVPRIKLWRYNDEKYFKPGLKPRYIDTTPSKQ